MYRFWAGLPDMILLAYLDDLILLSVTFAEHLDQLRCVLARLQEYSLQLNRGKCHFVWPEVRYVGDVITAEGIKRDP